LILTLCRLDEFIDVICGNRKYLKCLYVYNKIDQVTIEDVDRLAREPGSVVISGENGWNLDRLVAAIWDALQLLRIYTKKRGGNDSSLLEICVCGYLRDHCPVEFPDLNGGLIVRSGSTIEHVVRT
jgi:ribosome-interacting GTPase 1